MDTRSALNALGVQRLTGDQLRRFDTDGFFVLDSVFSPEECAEMVAEFDRLWEVENLSHRRIVVIGHVTMSQHDSFGITGTAARKLEKGEIRRRDIRR